MAAIKELFTSMQEQGIAIVHVHGACAECEDHWNVRVRGRVAFTCDTEAMALEIAANLIQQQTERME